MYTYCQVWRREQHIVTTASLSLAARGRETWWTSRSAREAGLPQTHASLTLLSHQRLSCGSSALALTTPHFLIRSGHILRSDAGDPVQQQSLQKEVLRDWKWSAARAQKETQQPYQNQGPVLFLLPIKWRHTLPPALSKSCNTTTSKTRANHGINLATLPNSNSYLTALNISWWHLKESYKLLNTGLDIRFNSFLMVKTSQRDRSELVKLQRGLQNTGTVPGNLALRGYAMKHVTAWRVQHGSSHSERVLRLCFKVSSFRGSRRDAKGQKV